MLYSRHKFFFNQTCIYNPIFLGGFNKRRTKNYCVETQTSASWLTVIIHGHKNIVLDFHTAWTTQIQTMQVNKKCRKQELKHPIEKINHCLCKPWLQYLTRVLMVCRLFNRLNSFCLFLWLARMRKLATVKPCLAMANCLRTHKWKENCINMDKRKDYNFKMKFLKVCTKLFCNLKVFGYDLYPIHLSLSSDESM